MMHPPGSDIISFRPAKARSTEDDETFMGMNIRILYYIYTFFSYITYFLTFTHSFSIKMSSSGQNVVR